MNLTSLMSALPFPAFPSELAIRYSTSGFTRVSASSRCRNTGTADRLPKYFVKRKSDYRNVNFKHTRPTSSGFAEAFVHVLLRITCHSVVHTHPVFVQLEGPTSSILQLAHLRKLVVKVEAVKESNAVSMLRRVAELHSHNHVTQ